MSTRTQLLAPLATVLLAATAWCVPCQAQSPAINVNVPFGFEVNDQHYGPGQYLFSTDSKHLVFMHGPGRNAVLFPMEEIDSNPSHQTKLVFHALGSRRFLAGLYIQGLADHLRWTVSSSEKQEILAANRAQPTETTLASVQPHR